MKKKRLDCLIAERGLAESREKAKIAVMMGDAYVDGQKQDKPGTMLPETVKIELRGEKLRYVSRGGLKLEKALARFPVDLKGKTALDIGASTGGFTDCMLQNGAKKVYAVDVGYGQLAWKLRTDPRVVCLERTNVRYLTREQVPEPVDFFSADVAFISLKLVLPVARRFLAENGCAVCLIKPQFEAGREKVGKKGVVRDPQVHVEVVRDIVGFCLQNGFSVCGLTYSPVKGPQGNIEYLVFLQKSNDPVCTAPAAEEVVRNSHRDLNGGETS
ncbi:MAG TPA: TlyA family rRNA (cytidine-2'-O)-methyltransferase [Ruminococcaceae bacterium]|jgi:23S rRNA (cytidine1920-2'-O)/16S rRNA (cytidine1409-2'-O)-methyltransferase|nr:TlyA family rRNA (cytidine-2'-O)-methyltransferase [Oscillospiraceae bacterium]HBG55560.1 TlyA family rRNA (cytidine-2'-O)-methyltransferase [Oscillospiraceae bacterium]HBQ45759.1 TlyA family rRNA (cytidine-2'-O)-methyltransferase [Oscillospiraceae bacterium]HBT91774.1 TlyA family rRNA (cytidine-2'-O)-methyltransferase [Oscillospiraceae bacterium]HCB90974.1 TlyA family rRNA (cytidine-2'-O)-methyltransferase [Oscillospiraceae bacterium]